MIRIIKAHWKWRPGDKPTVCVGYADELVSQGIAEYLTVNNEEQNGKTKRNINRRLRG